jgi:hypothetical protein
VTGRFNLFQRMMLRWRDLHPYNPVHVVRIPAPLDVERLRACIAERLGASSLTGLVVDLDRWRFRYEGGPAGVALRVVPAGSDPTAVLTREIERELNTPFPRASAAEPFRFCALDSGGGFQLALAYDHFVAGGDSIARLLTAIACAYLGRDVPAPRAVQRYPATYRSVVLRHPVWTLRAVLGLPALVAGARRTHRPRYGNIEDCHNAFAYFCLGPSQMRALVATGRAWGVTLNDLLMASLLQALSPFAAERRLAPRRTELAVASIVNIRSDFRAGADDALAPFLAAFRVAHPVPEGIGLRQLVADVHAATARIKRRHLYLRTIIALAASALMWRFLSLRGRHAFYAKHHPASAGITTLNVNAIWNEAGAGATAGLDYLRAVPTGPLCPAVFAVTTVRDVAHVGIAFRTSAYSRAAVSGLSAELVRIVDALDPEAAR